MSPPPNFRNRTQDWEQGTKFKRMSKNAITKINHVLIQYI